MKTLILLLLLLCDAVFIQAQISQNLPTDGTAEIVYRASNPSRVACANDELDYAIAKNIGSSTRLIGLQANQTTAIAAGSQYFPAPQPVTVSGLWVLGRKPNAGTISLKASIYTAGADSIPVTELGSGTVTITSTSTSIGYVEINFASPITVSQPYVVAIENMTASPAFQICTNYFTAVGDTASGRNERLSDAKYGGNWMDPGLLFTGFNADFIISPKVSYANTADFTLSTTSACVNAPVTLTNTSSPLYSSRFYNTNKFMNHFFGEADSTFLWTLPSGEQYSTDAVLNSATSGIVDAKLKATLVPWQSVSSCVDSITHSVTYLATDDATFTYSSNVFCSVDANPVPTTSNAGIFSGSAGLNFIDTSTGEIDLTTTDAGSYTVTYTTSGTCSANSSQTIDITTAPDASFSYASIAFCPDDTNPLPVFSTGAAGTFSSDAGLNIDASTGEINLATSTAGTYTVTNTISASGACPDISETFDVTINALPTATISGGGIICAGSEDSVLVSIALTGASPWELSIFDGTTTTPVTSIGSSPYEILVPETLAGTYKVLSVSDAVCSNTSSDSVIVSVSPVPTVDAIGNQILCEGDTTTTISFSGSVAGSTFAWTNDAPAIGLASSGIGDIDSFTAEAGSATITVTPTVGSCVGAASTFTITVNAVPTVDAIGNQILCEGDTTTTISFSGSVAGSTFAWTNDTPAIGLASSGTGDIDSFTAEAGSATITVTPTADGCVGAASTFTITVNAIPTVDAIGNQILCESDTTTTISFSGSIAGSTFAWTNDTPTIGLASSGTGDIDSFTAEAGSATITVTPAADGCVGAASTFTITVNTMPTVTFTAPATVCVYNSSFALTPGTPAGGSFSGNGVNGSNFDPATAGLGMHVVTYTVTQNGCTGTADASVEVDACLGIEGLDANESFMIYPNPSTGNVTFEFGKGVDANLSIMSTEGKTVYQNSNLQESQTTLDLSFLAHGTYLVHVTINGKTSVSKLILNK